MIRPAWRVPAFLGVLALVAGVPRALLAEDWPLSFKRHNFGFVCFDTQACGAVYHGHRFGSGAPTPPASSLDPKAYDRALSASYLDAPRDTPPVRAEWTSRDGVPLRAEIDIAGLFRDGLVRHNLARDEIAEGVSIGSTSVIVEIVDRTVSVYTRTFIPTRREQEPGNRYSGFREDLIKVDSRTY